MVTLEEFSMIMPRLDINLEGVVEAIKVEVTMTASITHTNLRSHS